MAQWPPETDGKSTVTRVTNVGKVSSLLKIPALLLFSLCLACLKLFLCITIVVLRETLKQQIFSCRYFSKNIKHPLNSLITTPCKMHEV